MRDTYEKLSMHPSKDRGRFGDNEYAPRRANEDYKSDIVDLTLLWRIGRDESIAVANPKTKDGEPWIFLPKSKIEFTRKPGGMVDVQIPAWLAKDKGLL